MTNRTNMEEAEQEAFKYVDEAFDRFNKELLTKDKKEIIRMIDEVYFMDKFQLLMIKEITLEKRPTLIDSILIAKDDNVDIPLFSYRYWRNHVNQCNGFDQEELLDNITKNFNQVLVEKKERELINKASAILLKQFKAFERENYNTQSIRTIAESSKKMSYVFKYLDFAYSELIDYNNMHYAESVIRRDESIKVEILESAYTYYANNLIRDKDKDMSGLDIFGEEGLERFKKEDLY